MATDRDIATVIRKIWIRTPDDGVANGRYEGKNIIIDGGPDASDEKNALFAYVQARAHPQAVIDALLITHPHDDHYPGAYSILNHYDVRAIYDPNYPKGGEKYPAFRARLEAEPTAALMFGRDVFAPLDWGSELKAEILYSYGGDPTGPEAETPSRTTPASCCGRSTAARSFSSWAMPKEKSATTIPTPLGTSKKSFRAGRQTESERSEDRASRPRHHRGQQRPEKFRPRYESAVPPG